LVISIEKTAILHPKKGAGSSKLEDTVAGNGVSAMGRVRR